MAISLKGNNESTYSNDVTTSGDLSAAAGTFAGGDVQIASDGKSTFSSTRSHALRRTGLSGSTNPIVSFESDNSGSIAEVASVRGDGSFMVGGTLPANPNITLNATNGVGYMRELRLEGYTGGSPNGNYDSSAALRRESQSGTSSAVYIGNQRITTSSDIRIKKDIEDTTLDVIEKLKQVRVVDFAWDDPTDQCFNNRNARGRWTGVIAQELVEVFPFAVNAPRTPETKGAIDHNDETPWTVNQDQLVPVLIKAFQESITRIEALEAEVQALKGGN